MPCHVEIRTDSDGFAQVTPSSRAYLLCARQDQMLCGRHDTGRRDASHTPHVDCTAGM